MQSNSTGGPVRALFLLLLLANVLFLAWTRWVEPSSATDAFAADSASAKLQPIRLRSEPAFGAATAASTAPTGDSLLAATCVSVGPFIDPAHVDTARAQLERLGFSSRQRMAQDEVRVGYWVRVPGFATPADAANALGTLQAAGLGEAYVVDAEEAGTTLSIGVYADALKAAEIAGTVQDAGFTPATSDRLRTLEVLWLDVDRQANGGLPAMEDLGEPPAGALPYDMRACPAAGSADGVTPAANTTEPRAAAQSAG